MQERPRPVSILWCGFYVPLLIAGTVSNKSRATQRSPTKGETRDQHSAALGGT